LRVGGEAHAEEISGPDALDGAPHLDVVLVDALVTATAAVRADRAHRVVVVADHVAVRAVHAAAQAELARQPGGAGKAALVEQRGAEAAGLGGALEEGEVEPGDVPGVDGE